MITNVVLMQKMVGFNELLLKCVNICNVLRTHRVSHVKV